MWNNDRAEHERHLDEGRRGCYRRRRSQNLQGYPHQRYDFQGLPMRVGPGEDNREEGRVRPGRGTVQNEDERGRHGEAKGVRNWYRGEDWPGNENRRRWSRPVHRSIALLALVELEESFVQLRRRESEKESHHQVCERDGGRFGEDHGEEYRHFRSRAQETGIRYVADKKEIHRRLGWRVDQTAYFHLLRRQLLRQLQGDHKKSGKAVRQ